MIIKDILITGGAMMLIANASASQSNSDTATIITPSLAELNGRRLRIELPETRLRSRPKSSDWKTIETDYECIWYDETQKGNTKLFIQLIRWPISRAERKGDLEGQKIKIATGELGIVQRRMVNGLGNRECASSVTLPIYSTNSALFLKITPENNLPVNSEECKKIISYADRVFVRIAIIK